MPLVEALVLGLLKQGVRKYLAVFGSRCMAARRSQSLRTALETARSHEALIHVPVYGGGDPIGGMGAYGSWNVGNWVADVETKYLETAI